MRFWSAFALLSLLATQPVSAQPAAAQPAPSSVALPAATAPAPPSRVGAVTYLAGSLAFHAPGDNQWSAAGINYPFATGSSFWTDPQARAQIQIGPTTLSMDGGSEIDVTNLNEEVTQLGLPQGRIQLHLRQLDPGQSFEIDLPQGTVWLLQAGSYDIDAGNPDRGARIAVFAGSARFDGSSADTRINSGDAVVLSRTNPATLTRAHAQRDAFVDWCTAHDYREDRIVSSHYISPHMTGYADLSDYGDWRASPQYGEVWYPKETPADWAPYRDGHWIWVSPWGWTWVDQQPWGFAPFHYGRWAQIDNRWGWVPGNYVAQPVYAPALVAFVGLGAGIGAAVAAGPAVGWFPLAPGEAYWPSYTRNPAYIRNLNITNVKDINQVIAQSHGGAAPPQVATANFANRRFATVVPQRVFVSADPVAPAALRVPAAALQKAPVAPHPPQIAPVVAKSAVAGPPRGLPEAAGFGRNRPAPNGSAAPAEPPHPGAAPEHLGTTAAPPIAHAELPPHPGPGAPHAGGPGAAPPTTRALPPPRLGEVAPAEHKMPGLPAAAGHPHPAAPATTAVLPPRPAALAPHQTTPTAAGPEHRPPPAPGATRETTPATGVKRPEPTGATIHPAAAPHPEQPRAHPPATVQADHAGDYRGPASAHPAATTAARPRPELPAAHPAPAAAHVAAPVAVRPPHVIQPAAQIHPQHAPPVHPPAAHPGPHPAPKEKGRAEDERP